MHTVSTYDFFENRRTSVLNANLTQKFGTLVSSKQYMDYIVQHCSSLYTVSESRRPSQPTLTPPSSSLIPLSCTNNHPIPSLTSPPILLTKPRLRNWKHPPKPMWQSHPNTSLRLPALLPQCLLIQQSYIAPRISPRNHEICGWEVGMACWPKQWAPEDIVGICFDDF